jgi:hypothetical protein
MNQNHGHNFFMSGMMGLANALALVAAFLLTPPVYNGTVDWVVRYMSGQLGYNYSGLISLAWGCLCAFTIYHFGRATIGTAIVMGALGVALRFL